LFGGISYTFGYSTSQGFYSCLQSEGLYLTAFVSVFGQTFSVYKDDPTTEKDESKLYLIDPIECASSTNSSALALSTLEIITIQTDNTGEFSLKNLENFLDQKAQELIQEYKQESSVCAKVTIKIDQEAVMTRAAFLGNLEIENGNATNLENLSVILQIKDENGNIVNDKFGITDPILSNITAVDGTGILT
ncbi:MAG: hypothetical protein ACKPCI_12035, partial [Dolichospermum sp.]